jgi:hypothetical protein
MSHRDCSSDAVLIRKSEMPLSRKHPLRTPEDPSKSNERPWWFTQVCPLGRVDRGRQEQLIRVFVRDDSCYVRPLSLSCIHAGWANHHSRPMLYDKIIQRPQGRQANVPNRGTRVTRIEMGGTLRDMSDIGVSLCTFIAQAV